jgi:D-xylose transport system substrate-binding protein
VSVERHALVTRIVSPSLYVVAVLVGLLALGSSCASDEGPRVAFLLAEPERTHKDAKYFEARAHELGLRVFTRVANRDAAAQLAQVEDVLARGAKILVIQPTDRHTAASYVRLAHEKGAKVVAYEHAIVTADLDYYVGHDSYRVGVLQADAALRATGGKGTFVLLSGEAGHPVAAEITRGYKDTLAPYIARGAVQIIVEQYHAAWSPEQAMRTVEGALARSGGKLDAVLANSSAMARGAIEAVAAAGLDRVFIAGANADAASVDLVCEGKQTIEVVKDAQPLARTAAEVARQLLDGQRPEPGASIALAGATVPVAAVRVELVTPDTVKALLIDTGVVSADEVPACKGRLALAR